MFAQKGSLQEQPGVGCVCVCLLSAAVQCSQSHVENQKPVQHGLLHSVTQRGFGVTESPDGYKHPTAKCVSRRERGMEGTPSSISYSLAQWHSIHLLLRWSGETLTAVIITFMLILQKGNTGCSGLHKQKVGESVLEHKQ